MLTFILWGLIKLTYSRPTVSSFRYHDVPPKWYGLLVCVGVRREETGDHPGNHKLLICADAPEELQVSRSIEQPRE